MYARLTVCLIFLVLTGCATSANSGKSGRSFNAKNLTVDLNSNDHQVLDAVPVESAMENFETIDLQGRIITYVAFTDTDIGALIFVDQKLFGTLSHRDAQAFYSCRGYATTPPNHWAHESADWVTSLLASSQPATSVKLEFSGKSTVQSVKEVAGNPVVNQMKSLLSIGSNPLSIFSSLGTAQSDMEARSRFDTALKGLSFIRPGMSELRVADVVKPEDVSFVSGGMVMAYPSHLVEYYVTGGVVKVIQQPSFHFLSKNHAALFYKPNTNWSLCTPQHWKEAFSEAPPLLEIPPLSK